MINGIAKTIIKTSLCASSLIPWNLGPASVPDRNNNFKKLQFDSLALKENKQTEIKYIDMLNEKEIYQNAEWGKNVRVLASNGQYLKAHTIWTNSFSTQLINKLKNKNIKTIEQANDTLAMKGYHTNTRKYHSLETPGEKLNIFNKDEVDNNFIKFNLGFEDTTKNKKRFLLTCVQDAKDLGEDFKKTEDYFTKNFKDIYKIPEENIIRVSAKCKQDFVTGMDSMSNKIKLLKDSLNTELLVLFIGHSGAITTKIDADTAKEGSASGYIFPEFDQDRNIKKALWENEIKGIFKQKFKECKALILFDSCFTGSFISQNIKPTTKKAMKLLG